MNVNEFLENFAALFDETDASEIKAETEFKSLDEWSSLMALTVISMIDDEYDVAINGNDIRESNTVEDLFQVVQSKK